MGRPRMTLARQYLGLQLLIVLAVLVVVAVISVAQTADAFRRTEGRRALQAAENLAAMPVVRTRLPAAEPGTSEALAAVGEAVRTQSGASDVALLGLDRTVVASSDPSLVGRPMPLAGSPVLDGASWTGLVRRAGERAVAAHAPVQDERTGEVVGAAVIERHYPSNAELLVQATPNLLTYLGVASLLGFGGSLLLARRVKRQTLGMEPAEIAGLVEHREAMLHGLKEGVVAVDLEERVTLANDSARVFLGLPEQCVGARLEELGVEAPLREALTRGDAPDRLLLVGERALTVNRRPMRSHGRVIGSVTTLRDRTELASLEQELGTTRATSETLRAQTHEFANQLHTISGLLQLGEYDEVLSFVDGVSHTRTSIYDQVTARIADPTLAALLIAKGSLAAERGVALRLTPASALGRLEEALSRDLTTVVGNLVDNAIEAVAGGERPQVEVTLCQDEGPVVVTVRDNGPGVAAGHAESVFAQGWTTKADDARTGRGFGLALTRLVCRRRGGTVTVQNDGGAVFVAVLPPGGGDR